MTKPRSKPSAESASPGEVDLYVAAGKTTILARRCCALVAPPPKLTVSEWADDRRMLPKTSAEPGRWKTTRTPYLKDPMDACSDPTTKRVVLMFASQVGKSECLLNIGGYFIDYDPAAMLMIQPTVEMAEAFSKERLAPMLTDTPTLADKVADPRSRDSNNTILRKEYPGGFVVLIGANAPAGLASRPIRIVLSDEIDRYPVSAGSEGDPLSLAEKRTTTFWNSLIVVVSTPTVKGESRIEAEYENSSQEVWCVPCPSCGVYQPYEWGRLDFDDAEMSCVSCGCLHTEAEWKDSEGEWIAREEHPTCRGYHLSAMASPWLNWRELIDEFKDAHAKGPEVLKTFVNTRLAECYEEAGETVGDKLLADRRRDYGCDVPSEVTWVTAGVDVQQDRLELEIVGWGEGKRSWGILYSLLPGDPNEAAVWDDLDRVLQSTFEREDGKVLPVSCACIDSGYATSQVYAYCRPRMVRNVFAVKGQGGPGKPVVGKYSWVGNRKVALFPVGTDAAKDLVYSRLLVDEHSGGYSQFPCETVMSSGQLRGYNDDYFKGLVGERRVPRKAQGRVYHTWVKRSSRIRNEPLDCRVYATAALEISNWDMSKNGAMNAGTTSANVGKSRRTKRRRQISAGVE